MKRITTDLLLMDKVNNYVIIGVIKKYFGGNMVQ